MKRVALGLLVASSVTAWGAAAQDAPVRATELVHFEYSGGAAEPGMWWTRRTDECTVQFTNWTRVDAARRPQGVTGSRSGGMESLDRAGFYIGNTIANLRGIDPTFGTRTLALTDGRRPSDPPRPSPAPPIEPIDIADALARLMPQNIATYMPTLPRGAESWPPPTPVDLPEDVWLLKRDGTVIPSLRKTAVAESLKYCAAERCEQGDVYGFPASAATEAVAVGFRKDGVVTTRTLDSLAGLQQ
jgi:hypothetical protein